MILAIVSDSHGHVDRLERVITDAINLGARTIVHCGDVGSARCIHLLGDAPIPAYLVAGNMDRFHWHLGDDAHHSAVNYSPKTIEVPIGDGQYLVATHGHDERLLDTLIAGGEFPYVTHGHTHTQRNERIGDVRIINPGALHHPRGHHGYSFALLDTEADKVTFVDVK
jgi:putative phosphoesterase